MGKVVTIPKDRNPFVVIVNGVKHSYPAGESIEVPDEVADVIEKYVGAKPKPDPNAGINFGGAQSDWNQTDSAAADFIKNKPFGDMPTGGDTLYWDGNTEGLEQFQSVFYKASDAVPTMADFSNGAYIYANTGEYMEVPADSITDDGTGVIIFDAFVVVYGELDGMPKGTYLMNMNGMYVSSLTIPGYTGFPVTKKMDSKYVENRAVFYFGDDNYIYTDITYNTKVTREELLTAHSKNSIYLNYAGYAEIPIVYIEGAFSEYATVIICFTATGGVPEWKAFYTAEYVPET